MIHPSFLRPLLPAVFVLALVALCGCNKSVRGSGLDNVAYTKGHTMVRAEPDPAARVLASAGPNVRVTVFESKNAFSRISIDDGRVTGWVAATDLSDTPVTERAASRPAPQAKPKPARHAAQAPATAETAAGPDMGPDTEKVAPAETAAPAAAPQAAAEAQAAAETQGGLLSPRAAQAATPPAEPAPAAPPPPSRGRQANPDAFDPF